MKWLIILSINIFTMLCTLLSLTVHYKRLCSLWDVENGKCYDYPLTKLHICYCKRREPVTDVKNKYDWLAVCVCVAGALQGGIWEEQRKGLQRCGRHTRAAENQENTRPNQQRRSNTCVFLSFDILLTFLCFIFSLHTTPVHWSICAGCLVTFMSNNFLFAMSFPVSMKARCTPFSCSEDTLWKMQELLLVVTLAQNNV